MGDQRQIQLQLEQHQLHLLTGGKGGSIADLRHAHMSEIDLRGINLSGADLRYASFSHCVNPVGLNLSQSNLEAAILDNANFSFIDLSDSNLKAVRAIDANFSGADLSGANLRNANLRGANLQNARLQYADLRGAKLDGANLENAYLGFCVPNMAEIKGAYFGSPDLPIVWLWERGEIIVWFGCHRKSLEDWNRISRDNRLVRSHDPYNSWGEMSSKLFEIIRGMG